MRPFRLLVAATAASLLPVSCAGADGPSPGDPVNPPPAEASEAAGAGGTAPRAFTLEEALASDGDGPILVTGLLIDAGDGWRLCAAVAESFPPQCGGASVTVEELDPADHDLQDAGGVRWSESATLFGELDGTTFTVRGPASAA
jgi:hypothetical protein